MKTKTYLWLFLVLSILLIPIGQAFAYSGTNAASYADSWALTYNTGKYPQYSSDCTNFVSQCLYEGGKPMDYSGSYQWWLDFYNNWTHSNSWTIAMELYNWFVNNPAGSRVYYYSSLDGSPPNYVSALSKGDIVFYDWGTGDSISHAGIITVTNGTDPNQSSYTGTLQDQHSNARYHAIWHLKPYNSNWATTVFRVYRPS